MARWVHITSLLALEVTSMVIFVEMGPVTAAIYVLGVVGAGLTGFNLGSGGRSRPAEETRVRYQCRECGAAVRERHLGSCSKSAGRWPPRPVTLEDCVEVAGMVTVTDPRKR